MKPTPNSTLDAVFPAQPPKTGESAPGNWIAAFLEALYELQRHQALKVIRAYKHFLGLPDDGAESDRDDVSG